MVVDVQFLIIEFVVFNVMMFFVDSIQIYGMGQQVVCMNCQFMWVEWFGDVVICIDFEVENFIDFVVMVSQEY